MNESLGKCMVCGGEAAIVYPLLPWEPAFCSEHYNLRDAGPFGCGFSDPDDFDIPFNDEDIPFRTPRLQRLDRETFVWVDIRGNKHTLKEIDDNYLRNIINYLERDRGHVPGTTGRRGKVIDFLRNELEERRRLAHRPLF